MYHPQRLAVKLFASSPELPHEELEGSVALFHRYIQTRRLPGLLLDVANYAHLPHGPGVILIGHDVDYGIDLSEGRPGLLVTRKRNRELVLPELLRDALRRALCAAAALELDGPRSLRLDPGALEIRVPDRLALRNDAEGYAALADAARPLLGELFAGADAAISHASAGDPRKLLALAARVSDSPKAGELLARLGGPPP